MINSGLNAPHRTGGDAEGCSSDVALLAARCAELRSTAARCAPIAAA